MDYSERFRKDVLPHLLDSAVFLSLGTEIGTFDVKQATELGAALLYDKRILLIVPKGRTVGVRLRRAADVVIDDWESGDAVSEARITEALRGLLPHAAA